jgi:hypothetical protein
MGSVKNGRCDIKQMWKRYENKGRKKKKFTIKKNLREKKRVGTNG